VVYSFKGADMSLGGRLNYVAQPSDQQVGNNAYQPLPQFTGDDPYSQIMAMMPAFRNPYANASSGNALGGFDPSIYTRNYSSGGGEGGGDGGVSGGGVGGNVSTIGSGLIDSGQSPVMPPPVMPSPDEDFPPTYVQPMPSPDEDFPPTYVQPMPEPMPEPMPDDPYPYPSETMPEPVPANPADFGAVDGGYGSNFEPANPSDFGAVDAGYGSNFAPASPSDFGGDFGGSDMNISVGQMAGYAKGGMVHGLLGPNPKGPDDGAAFLDRGEYVIRKSSVKKYGRGLLDMINEGKVPAKKIKSLLD
jgi:hypothetical protein